MATSQKEKNKAVTRSRHETDELVNELAQTESGLQLSRQSLQFRKAVIRYHLLGKPLNDIVELMTDVFNSPDRVRKQVMKVIDETERRLEKMERVQTKRTEAKKRNKSTGTRHLDGQCVASVTGRETKYFDRDLNEVKSR